MNAIEKIIGIVGCLLAILGIAFALFLAVAMVGVGGAGGTSQERPVGIFPLPLIAIFLEFLTLKSMSETWEYSPCSLARGVRDSDFVAHDILWNIL